MIEGSDEVRRQWAGLTGQIEEASLARTSEPGLSHSMCYRLRPPAELFDILLESNEELRKQNHDLGEDLQGRILRNEQLSERLLRPLLPRVSIDEPQ